MVKFKFGTIIFIMISVIIEMLLSQINLTFMHNFSPFCGKILRNVSFNSPFLAFTLAFNGSCITVCHSAFQQLRCATGRCGVSLLKMILYRPL